MADVTQDVLVKRIGYEAERINSYELIARSGGELVFYTHLTLPTTPYV